MSDIQHPTTIISGGGSVFGDGNPLAINSQGACRVTGDVNITSPIVIGTVNVGVSVTGDTRADQSGGWSVAISGDVPIRQDATNTAKGTLSTPIGVQIVGGSVGSRISASGDLTIAPSTTNATRFPVSGDFSIGDGVTLSTKATVKSFTNSNPLAVHNVNLLGKQNFAPSGDRTYWSEVINVTATGDNTIHSPAAGLKFYVVSIQCTVGASGSFLFKSGTTNITGPLKLNAYGSFIAGHELAPLRGAAIANQLILTVTNPSTLDVGGYATGYDE